MNNITGQSAAHPFSSTVLFTTKADFTCKLQTIPHTMRAAFTRESSY